MSDVFTHKGNDWIDCKTLKLMRQGLVTGIDAIDAAAIAEGQASRKINSYSKKTHIWELKK